MSALPPDRFDGRSLGKGSSTKVSRAERILDILVKRFGLTPAGKAWLICALDAFHDNSVDPAPYPDGVTTPGVAEWFKLTVNVAVPSGLAGANWDLLIMDWPYSSAVNSEVYNWDDTHNALSYASNTAFQTGGLCGYAIASGSTFPPAFNAPIFQLVLDPTWTVGKYRITAKAFEVHDVTSVLNRQGSVLGFNSPLSSLCDSTLSISSNGVGTVPILGPISELPAVTTSNAIRLFDSKQWKAEEGIYSVSRFNDLGITALQNDARVPIFVNAARTAALSEVLVSELGSYGPSVKAWGNFDLNSAYFSGLNTSANLLINWRVMVERFPGLSTSLATILPFARTMPQLDPIAMEVYSHVISSMPCGVRVDENSFGDWFANAASKVASAIHPIASMVPTPAGLMTSMITGAISGKGSPQVQKMVSTIKKDAVKAKNEEIRAKNELIRAKNVELAARKTAKKK